MGTEFWDGFLCGGILTCKVVEFGTTPAYVQGSIRAEIAILTNAEEADIASPGEELNLGSYRRGIGFPGDPYLEFPPWASAPCTSRW